MSKSRSTDEDRADRQNAPAISRRALFAGAGGVAALGLFARVRPKTPASTPARKGKGPRVVVVGAGAFGGWTALHLLRRGAKVTLVDSWGPGNSRASSGGETRVIRGGYGASRIYTQMAARAFVLWKENEERWKRKLYRRTGALWMLADEGQYVRDSLPLLKDSGFPFEELSIEEAARRYPQVSFSGLKWALVEKEAGYLLARQSCATVLEGFLAEGGEYRQATVEPGVLENGALAGLRLDPVAVARPAKVRAYATRHGCLQLGGRELALTAIAAERRRFETIAQPDVLARVRDELEPGADLDEFILRAIRDPAVAAARTAQLRAGAAPAGWR